MLSIFLLTPVQCMANPDLIMELPKKNPDRSAKHETTVDFLSVSFQIWERTKWIPGHCMEHRTGVFKSHSGLAHLTQFGIVLVPVLNDKFRSCRAL